MRIFQKSKGFVKSATRQSMPSAMAMNPTTDAAFTAGVAAKSFFITAAVKATATAPPEIPAKKR